MIRLGLADDDDPVGRQVIGRDEFKRDFSVGTCFQTPLPIGECAKFFADVFRICDRFLATIADCESFLGQAELCNVSDIIVERLVSADRKRVRRIKFGANLRQLPITQREHCIINREYQEIDISGRFTFGSDQNVAAD